MGTPSSQADIIRAQAEADKLRVEAEAVKKESEAKTEAVKKESEAKAKAVKKESEAKAKAVKKESEAKTEAVKKESEAKTEAVKKESEAKTEAVKKESEAKAKESEAKAARIKASLALVGLGTLFLGMDYILHEVSAVIEFRVLRKLRDATSLLSVEPGVPKLLDVGGPLDVDTMPTMILGPTGSGKSTLMRRTAREIACPSTRGLPSCPVMYIHMRQAKQREGEEDTISGDATTRLKVIAELVYKQIGFPRRRALVYTMLGSLTSISFGSAELKMEKTKAVADRFSYALRVLFEMAARVYDERRRRSDIPAEHAPPVLLFDEVQDLVKTKRMADAGGRDVFEQLAVLLVQYGIDSPQLRTAVAGSSAMLAVEFDKTVASGDRWNFHEMTDPAPSAVINCLVEKGYTEAEAQSMVDLVGPRLRLLHTPLTKGAVVESCSKFLLRHRSRATKDLDDLLAHRGIRDILDRIVAHENGEGKALKLKPMSDVLREVEFSKVLYVNLDTTLTFQSQLIRNVWKSLKDEYTPVVPQAQMR
jgi:hypothetical protein